MAKEKDKALESWDGTIGGQALQLTLLFLEIVKCKV